MVIKKNTKDTIWDEKWQGKVKWLGKSLEDSKKQKLEKLIDEGVACKTETDTLKADYDSKNREYTDAKQARLTHVGGARNEKNRLNGGAVNHSDGAVDNKSTWGTSMTAFQTTWNTNGWENVNQAHYPADYLDNLYDLKDQTFKITEDETVKLLSRVIYEIGKVDKADYVNNHGITDATKKPEAEAIFDNIKLCSQAIEQMNSKGASANDLTKKTWDLPFTYSEEQKILATGKNTKAVNARWNLVVANQHTFLSNVFKFVKEYLTADCIGKLDQKTVNITETEDWKISKSGEVYTEEELKDYGITLTDPKKTFLYRTNPKEVHDFKVTGGLNGWISLFNSVLEKQENQDKLVASYTNSPTQTLFNDLRTQDGIDTAFSGNRLPETETAIDELIDDLKLKKSANEKKCNELEDGVKKAKKSYTDKNYEHNQKVLESNSLVQETLTAKKKEFEDFHVEKGFEDKTSTGGEDNRRSFEDLFKIKQTILEVRYLEHNGDATLTSSLTIPASFTDENALITKLEELMNWRYGKEEYHLAHYFKTLETGDTNIIDAAITKIENGEGITGYLGIEPKERFQAFIDSFQEYEKAGGLSAEEKASLDKLVEKIGGTPTETPQQWTDKLKAIDGLTAFVVNDTLKTKWISLPNKQFEKIDKVESLVKETLGSDNKVDTKFITEATAKKATLTSLAEVLKEDPKEVIILVERYKFNKLDDSATSEKDKKKTQQTRRIKKALKDKDSNFDITKDLDDATLNNALYQVKVGELTVNASKYYTADLKEITSEIKETNEPFLRWNNPWVYVTGAVAIGAVAAIIYWDKIVTWFNQGADDQGEDEDND